MSLLVLLVLLGLATALQPVPIISYIVVLNSQARIRAGWAFLVGWTGSLLAVMAIAVFIVVATGGARHANTTTPGKATSVVLLLFGLLLIVVGFRRLLRGTPPNGPPKILQRLKVLTLPLAALIGALVQPWTLLFAGDLAVLKADLRQLTTLIAIAFCCLLASAGMLVMQCFAVKAPDRANDRLIALRDWIESHQSAAITWLAIVIGAWLAIQGGTGLL